MPWNSVVIKKECIMRRMLWYWLEMEEKTAKDRKETMENEQNQNLYTTRTKERKNTSI